MEPRNRLVVDENTGFYTREGFLSMAQQMGKLAARKRREVVLLHAHLENGDGRARAAAAELLQETFRKSDVLSAFDADEFVMAAIETRKGGAEALAARLLENVRRYNDERAGGRQRLSIRVGSASFDPETAATPADILAKTEEMLKSDAELN